MSRIAGRGGFGPGGDVGPALAAASPGRWLRRLTVAHAALGAVVYRRELREIATRRFVATVPYRSERAAALWFIGSALPGWLVGRLVDVAAESGDADAVAVAGALGLAAALGGALLMPVSSFWLQALACGEILRASRRLSGPVVAPARSRAGRTAAGAA